MQKLYQKAPLLFAILFIVVYVVGMSSADEASKVLDVQGSFSLLFSVALSALLLVFILHGKHRETFGLVFPRVRGKRVLFYLPLVALVSVNFWLGLTLNLSPLESVLTACCMLFVGFLEEVIFRGLLFCAMARDNQTAAIVVSSVTFGIGHIVNLFNASGAELVSTALQVVYATAAGFLFVVLFLKTKSLLPAIFTHSFLNASSVFANEAARTLPFEILSAAFLTLVAAGYAIYLWRALPEE